MTVVIGAVSVTLARHAADLALANNVVFWVVGVKAHEHAIIKDVQFS